MTSSHQANGPEAKNGQDKKGANKKKGAQLIAQSVTTQGGGPEYQGHRQVDKHDGLQPHIPGPGKAGQEGGYTDNGKDDETTIQHLAAHLLDNRVDR